MNNPELGTMYFVLIGKALQRLEERYRIAVDASPEDTVRLLVDWADELRKITVALSGYSPRFAKVIQDHREERRQELADADTRRAERGELEGNFLDDIPVSPEALSLLEAVSGFASLGGVVPPIDPRDNVIKLSRAVAARAAEQHESSEDFEDRIVAEIEEQMRQRQGVVKAVS